MNRKNLIFKIIASIIALGLMITAFIVVAKKEGAKDSGTITIELVDLENNVLSTKNHDFKKGDTLFQILDNNYDLEYQNEVYGVFITKIDELYAPNRNEYFIKIEVNGEFSSVGVSQIKLEDQMIITFTLTKVILS